MGGLEKLIEWLTAHTLLIFFSFIGGLITVFHEILDTGVSLPRAIVLFMMSALSGVVCGYAMQELGYSEGIGMISAAIGALVSRNLIAALINISNDPQRAIQIAKGVFTKKVDLSSYQLWLHFISVFCDTLV